MTKSLAGFLTFLKTSYLREQVARGDVLNIVCGNQSCDMDSVMSSLTYAYYSYLKRPEQPVIPVLNIPKEDLKLRKDIVFVLAKKANISESDDLLFFIKDIANYKEQKKLNIHAVLVDHNNLQGEAEVVVDEIVGIIDHHEDTGTSRDSIIKYHGPDIIKVTGSCSSLVTNYWAKQLNDDFFAMRNTVELSLAAALIDTSNFKFKVEAPDQKALQIYKSQLSETYSFENFYKEIRKEKDNLDGLSMSDLLRKDYKQFEFGEYQVGMSSMVKPTSWLIEQYGANEIVHDCNEYSKGMDVLILLTSFVEKSTFHRELVIVTKNDKLRSQILKGIENPLKLEALPETSFGYTVYNQQNTDASRKQVAPAVQNAIEKTAA
ncbi:hypothetical protein ACO0QE_001778 [Hanseniaspora vineae]